MSSKNCGSDERVWCRLRVTVPFRAESSLHPKIIKQVLETIEVAANAAS
jgi:hypothetical protein